MKFLVLKTKNTQGNEPKGGGGGCAYKGQCRILNSGGHA